MADGSGRAGARYGQKYSDWAERQVEKAARRVARMYGFGSGWRCATILHDSCDGDAGSVQLNIAHRGYITEQAARRLGRTTTHVRRQHAWSIHRGVVAVPIGTPDTAGMAALSFAKLDGPEFPLLRAYACESFPDWLCVERFLWRELPSRNQVIAGRDAMARIMYGRAATAQDDRARDLGMRACAYRDETRAAEYVLRHWLLSACCRVNRCSDFYPPRLGASHGNGLRLESWWHPERNVTKDGKSPHQRHKC